MAPCRQVRFLLWACAVGAIGCAKSASPAHSAPPVQPELIQVGAKLPNLTLPAPGGGVVNLYDSLGGRKGIILDFWFVDCSPCIAEFHHLESIYPSLQKANIAVLAIDRIDSSNKVAKFAKDFPLRLPVALNGTGANEVDAAFGVTGSPTTVVADSQGKVVGVFEGEDDLGLAKAVARL